MDLLANRQRIATSPATSNTTAQDVISLLSRYLLMTPFWKKKTKGESMSDQDEKSVDEQELGEEAEVNEEQPEVVEPEVEETAKVEEIEPQDDWQDKYLRLVAEFDNFRRRTRKEQGDIRQRERGAIIRELLDVIDNFERAFSMEGIDESPLLGGIKGTFLQLQSLLKSYGVTEIQSKGMPFDPNLHEAVGTVENPDEEDDIVAEEVQKGYLLGESHVLRPSRVLVVRNG